MKLYKPGAYIYKLQFYGMWYQSRKHGAANNWMKHGLKMKMLSVTHKQDWRVDSGPYQEKPQLLARAVNESGVTKSIFYFRSNMWSNDWVSLTSDVVEQCHWELSLTRMSQHKLICTYFPGNLQRWELYGYNITSLCTDVPTPSGKIGRGDVCELPSLIVFRYTFA